MRLDRHLPHKADIRTYAKGTQFNSSALVGIEVELEKYTSTPPELKYWRAEHDGSLREGGIEFVLRQPLTGIDLELAVQELNDHVLCADYEVNRRCSTHVHIDARDISVQHLRAMVFVYMMVERLIYDMVNPDREDSFYCRPLYDSLLHRKQIAHALDCVVFDDCPRYSGLNLRSLAVYGSLEFRMKEGLSKDHDLIKWVKALMYLKSGTKQYADMELSDILKMYSTNTAESIIRAVFGDLSDELIAKGNYNDTLKPCMRSAQDLILFTNGDPVQQMEKLWLREFKGKNTPKIDGVDPEILQAAIDFRNDVFGA